MRAKCSFQNCTSGKPGLYEPIILLWPEKPSLFPSQPANVNCVGHALCTECIGKATPRDFIPTLADWIKICRFFDDNKKVRPTLQNAKLTFMVPETTKIIRGDKLA
jgi:hypothetical protein